MPCGNVVKYHGDLYVVADADYDYTNGEYTRMTLIPFNHSNSTTHLSKKHPFTMDIMGDPKICDDCRHEFDTHEDCVGCFNVKEIPNPELGIETVERVADSIKDFINARLRKIIYDV